MSEYARYSHWVLKGKCQICGQPANARQMCAECEEEINALAEQVA